VAYGDSAVTSARALSFFQLYVSKKHTKVAVAGTKPTVYTLQRISGKSFSAYCTAIKELHELQMLDISKCPPRDTTPAPSLSNPY
jgi:hypothetical protein